MSYFIILLVTCITITSQVLLKYAMRNGVSTTDIIDFFSNFLTNPYIISAIVLQGSGFVLWALVIKDLKLGVAFAISGASFYLLIALVDYIAYSETLKLIQVLGLVLISIGVFFVAYNQ